LQGQASLAEGWGLASWWFNALKAANPADADEKMPVVEYPAGDAALMMRTTRWDGFGNFNFALPQVGEPCRVRVVYYVDVTGVDNAWYNGGQKPFQVKLMDDGDQDTPDYPFVSELNETYWDNPGWRIAEFESNLEHDHYYISLLWDAAGLSCQRNVPMYVREVSVVPVSKLTGWTPVENASETGRLTVVPDVPEKVTISETGAVKNIAIDAAAPAEYFNLQGIRVAEPANGIFIRRQGDKTTKVAL
ncbi:MAG: hypothetical protein K2G30_10985, partial [Muribaculaceae bacterium]|nr:hypothetical protein [Muribaculaceae bacterium]